MIKLVVKKIESYNYTLENEKTNEIYEMSLKFFDLEKSVKIGDIITIHKELLNPNYIEYSNIYYFGPIDQEYGREVKTANDIELLTIDQDGKSIILKRFFG